MKKILTVIAAFALGAVMLFGGCLPQNGRDGRDGKDAQDVSVYELYEAAKQASGNENLTLDEFLREYLSYDDSAVQAAKNLQSMMNKSLMAGVSILSRFCYTSGSRPSSIPGLQTTNKSYKVYTGSGAILWLDKDAGDAYVVTNCHVIYDDTADAEFCDDVRLYLYGQDESGLNFVVDDNYNISKDENYRIEAEVIGASITYDIALLKVTGSEVLKRTEARTASFSDRTHVFVGETVYAVGNSSGEGLSVSNGIISKDSEYIQLSLSEKTVLAQDDYVTYRVMRTTAAVNHGNSGGALYNSDGEIVAIVNAKDDSEDVDNMGYALPANSVRRLLKLMYDEYVANGNKMLKSGGVNKALINITHTVTDSYPRYNENTGLVEIFETVVVEKVSGNPAKGKLQVGDCLKSFEIKGSDGEIKEPATLITRRYQLPEAMLSVRKGDTVNLIIERDKKETKISIKFDSNNYFTYYK